MGHTDSRRRTTRRKCRRRGRWHRTCTSPATPGRLQLPFPASEVVTDDIEKALRPLLRLQGRLLFGQLGHRQKEMFRAWPITDTKIQQKRIRSSPPWCPRLVEPPLRRKSQQPLELFAMLVGAIRCTPSSVPGRNHAKLKERVFEDRGIEQTGGVLCQHRQQFLVAADGRSVLEEARQLRCDVIFERLPVHPQAVPQKLLGHRVIALFHEERDDADGIIEVARKKRALRGNESLSCTKDVQCSKCRQRLWTRFAIPTGHQIPDKPIEDSKVRRLRG